MVHRGSAWRGSQERAETTWRDVLRGRTRDAHGALDHALTGPTGTITDVDDYVRVVRTLHVLHAWGEDRLRLWATTSPLARTLPDDVVLPERAGLYEGDLQVLCALGGTHGAPAGADPSAVGEAEGVALLYLFGGSSAGARVLLRGVPGDVPLAARRGLTDASGKDAARLWQAVRSLLGAPVDLPLATRAADEAEALLGWLHTCAQERAA